MTLMSFCLTFAASASKLKPIAGIVALITAYALDLLGSVPGGELATRGILYAWLFVGIPAGVCIVVNLLLGPAPRRLAERALGASASPRRPRCFVRPTRTRGRHSRNACTKGLGEIPAWLKLAGAERTSPARDIASLQQAARSTIVILSVVDFLADGLEPALPASIRQRIAETLDGMAAILGKGGYPVEIDARERRGRGGAGAGRGSRARGTARGAVGLCRATRARPVAAAGRRSPRAASSCRTPSPIRRTSSTR